MGYSNKEIFLKEISNLIENYKMEHNITHLDSLIAQDENTFEFLKNLILIQNLISTVDLIEQKDREDYWNYLEEDIKNILNDFKEKNTSLGE